MIDTNSKEWRAECEARWLSKREPEQIKNYLALVAQKRGQKAAQELRQATIEEWSKRKQPAQHG